MTEVKGHFNNRTTNGFTNPEGTIQNLGILKNASTYFSSEATRQGWVHRAIPFNEKITRFIILRDPYERYISGLIEDLNRYLLLHSDKQVFFQHLIDNNFLFDCLDLFFDNGVFALEAHSRLQSEYVYTVTRLVSFNDLTFIRLTERLGDVINYFLQSHNCQGDFKNTIIHETQIGDPKSIASMVQYYFADARNHIRKEKLLQFLQPDYNLINSVNFINK